MVSTVFKFKGFVVFVMILLLAQQSFAALMPMNCDDMKNASGIVQDNRSHMTSKMHEDKSLSKAKMAHHHDECDVCDSNACKCSDMGLCIGSPLLTTSQTIENEYTLFVDHGKRFIAKDESPHSGIHLHLYRPPII